jgi:tetratricopeptide (TPR) repeat protein/ADP-heptose:LPS heptosyltransferase
MNRHERRASKAKAKTDAGKPQALAVLHAAILKETLAGRFLEALSRCQEALALDGENADTQHLVGAVHLEAKQGELAVEWISRAVRKNPKPEFLSTLGLALSNLGRHDDALVAFDQALQLRPGDAQLWWQKGNAFLAVGYSLEALRCFEQALQLNPRHADAAYRCGHILHGMRRFDDARSRLDRSVELAPEQAATLQLRALVLKELNRLEEALADNLRAAQLDPGNGDVWGNLGAILRTLGRTEQALSAFDRALQLRPDIPRVMTNKASALAELGRLDEAMAACRRAIAIDPSFSEAAWNLALLQLLLGDFESGWKGREVRWKFAELTGQYPRLSAPMWLGEQPVAGKTVLLCADEGLGDSIQFVRYAPMLAARGAEIVLLVEPPLVPILSGAKGVSRCLAKTPDVQLPPFDFHCSLTSLPLAFGTRLDTIPAEPYLAPAAADRVQAWEGRLGPHEKLRVGLVWSGNPKHWNDRNRSIPLRTLSRLFDMDVTFVSLQKDPRPQDAEMLRQRPGIVDLTAELTDFGQTAALLSCLDLLISVDTSVAHLAGALGRPVWLLLPHVPDFRWLLGRDDSPWYPTLRLFRQSATRAYENVLDRVHAELSVMADAFIRARR